MGAIYGFLGPRADTLLTTIGERLSHRGKNPANAALLATGSLAYAPPRRGASGKGAGLTQAQGKALVIAGHLHEWPSQDGSPDRSVSEQVLSAYNQRGEDVFSELRGAFVLALLDGDRLLLARDGSGLRTLYWTRFENRVLFAIEPKALLACPGFSGRLRLPALAQYLTFSFIPGPETMLEGVQELESGAVTELSLTEARTRFHFQHVPKAPTHLETGQLPRDTNRPSDAELTRQFSALFRHAVKERLPQTSEPVGVFLSGGLDSSVVVAELATQLRQLGQPPPRTYAIHFGTRYPNELEHARRVAEFCGTQHEEVLIQPKDFIPRLREIIWRLDDPVGDPITAPNYELARHVSRDLRWVYNGEGGDPLFGGPKNIPMLLNHWYGGLDHSPGFRERAYLASYRRGYEELGLLLSPEARSQLDPDRDLNAVLTPFFERETPPQLLQKLLLINTRLKGAHLILPKVERMTAAHGLLPQSPLFDEALVQFSMSTPGNLKLRNGVEKWIIKSAFQDRIPDSIIGRPKSGMRVPVHFWFKGEMKKYAASVLSPKRLRQSGLFNVERVSQLLDYDYENGPGRYGLKLWMLLTFELWRSMTLEGEHP